VKTLFLAWQAPSNRNWFPVGRLYADVNHELYVFNYTRGAIEARQSGFRPMPSFPDFEKSYRSSALFPMFKNRVLDLQRRDFDSYLQTLALDHYDPIEILAITGGERQTDSFEVFPKIEKQPDGLFHCRFFLHGLRHLKTSQERAMSLRVGEELGVSIELTNPTKSIAIQLTSRDYEFVGWAPRYLIGDLLNPLDCGSENRIAVTVVQVNTNDAPANRRVLVEFKGGLPADVEPMSSPQFQPIV
jgi:hypothetical protein